MELCHELTSFLIDLYVYGDTQRNRKNGHGADEAVARGFAYRAGAWVILSPKGHDLVVQRLVGRQLTFPTSEAV